MSSTELTDEQKAKRNEASKKNYQANRYKPLAYQREYNNLNRAKNIEYQADYFKKKKALSDYNKDYYKKTTKNISKDADKPVEFIVTF